MHTFTQDISHWRSLFLKCMYDNNQNGPLLLLGGLVIVYSLGSHSQETDMAESQGEL